MSECLEIWIFLSVSNNEYYVKWLRPEYKFVENGKHACYLCRKMGGKKTKLCIWQGGGGGKRNPAFNSFISQPVCSITAKELE